MAEKRKVCRTCHFQGKSAASLVVALNFPILRTIRGIVFLGIYLCVCLCVFACESVCVCISCVCMYVFECESVCVFFSVEEYSNSDARIWIKCFDNFCDERGGRHLHFGGE